MLPMNLVSKKFQKYPFIIGGSEPLLYALILIVFNIHITIMSVSKITDFS